jgi:hypothetical protein
MDGIIFRDGGRRTAQQKGTSSPPKGRSEKKGHLGFLLCGIYTYLFLVFSFANRFSIPPFLPYLFLFFVHEKDIEKRSDGTKKYSLSSFNRIWKRLYPHVR